MDYCVLQVYCAKYSLSCIVYWRSRAACASMPLAGRVRDSYGLYTCKGALARGGVRESRDKS